MSSTRRLHSFSRSNHMMQRSLDAKEFLQTIIQKESSISAYSFALSSSPSEQSSPFHFLDRVADSNDFPHSHLLDRQEDGVFDVNTVYDRLEAVQYLFDVVDHTNEDREIVQVAMNYFDRYILHTLRSNSSAGMTVSSAKKITTKPRSDDSTCSSQHLPTHHESMNVDDSDACSSPSTPPNSEHHRVRTISEEDLVGELFVQDEETVSPSTDVPSSRSSLGNENLSVVLLVCLDLAIKMYSPLSGNWSNVKRFYRNKERRRLKMMDKSSPYYVGTDFYSLRRLLDNKVSFQELDEIHQSVLKALEFYLHPPTSTQIVRCVMDLFGSYILQDCFSSIISKELCFSLLEQVFRSTMIQLELSMFDTKLSHLKPSIFTMASLENSFHQVFSKENVERHQRHHNRHRRRCDNEIQHQSQQNDSSSQEYTNINHVSPSPSMDEMCDISTGDIPKETHALLATEMTQTLSYISREIMKLTSSQDTEKIVKSRRLLFEYWKNNSPDMIHVDHFLLYPYSSSSSLSPLLEDSRSYSITKREVTNNGKRVRTLKY